MREGKRKTEDKVYGCMSRADEGLSKDRSSGSPPRPRDQVRERGGHSDGGHGGPHQSSAAPLQMLGGRWGHHNNRNTSPSNPVLVLTSSFLSATISEDLSFHMVCLRVNVVFLLQYCLH